jgi:hypothetical protein
VPAGYAGAVDTTQVKKVFPYGVCSLVIVEGGGLFSSGIALPGARRAPCPCPPRLSLPALAAPTRLAFRYLP